MEFGAGATTKVRLLLNECEFGAYVPVDISGDFLNAQADALRQDFPELDVHPVTADFTAPFALPETISAMPKVGFFPGSTLGNFEPHEACAFLRSARDILGKARGWSSASISRRTSACCTTPITMPPASPRASISMCFIASTANWAVISTLARSSIARSTIAIAIASRCI